jgi:dTDP-4-amino-4,6-dideoxygalactose transaminase
MKKSIQTKVKRIFLSPPHMGGEELRFIQEAFDSNYIAPLGPMVDAFEQEFAEKVGIPHTLAVSSGTAAMHLVLRHLGISPGNEVIASSMTFIGSVSPVIFQGAVPVFIDSDRLSWNMDAGLLEEELARCEKMGKLPKAVIPTDLYGQCCDYERIYGICQHYGVPVVVDAAEALGAKYFQAESSKLKAQSTGSSKFKDKINQTDQTDQTDKLFEIHAGKGARAAIFSFNGNKIITTSGGGMLASEDQDLIDNAKFLSQQARDAAPHYEHSQIGYNYRMSNILAAIGRGQLRVLDERVDKKRWIFNTYNEALRDLPGIEFMPEASYGKSNRWLTVVLVTPEEFGADRETVRLALEEENIESRPVWKPMHLQPVFDIERFKVPGSRSKVENKDKRYKARMVGGAVSEDLFNRGLCLPSGTQMTEEDLDRVINVIQKCQR